MSFLLRSCAVIALIVSIITGYFINTLYQLGIFKTITVLHEHGNENCEILSDSVPNLIGCEDAAQYEDGIIILSCADRTPLSNEMTSSKPISQIIRENIDAYPGFLFSMKNINSKSKDIKPIKITGRTSPDFHPHGIGLITHKNTKWIYLINHRRDGDVVEIFKYKFDTNTATFIDEIHSPYFVFINDLKPVVLPNDQIAFYVANSGGFPLKSKLSQIELFLGVPLSDLVYCEPERTGKYAGMNVWNCDVVDSNLGFGNGVEVSMDNKYVYVIETIALKLTIYERMSGDNGEFEGGELRKVESFATHSACDNMHLDRMSGDLYIGCHPNILPFFKHSLNHSEIAPSQILHWNASTQEIEEIYLSDGNTDNHVSGSSVGIYEHNSKTLLIGTVNVGVMRCHL